MSWQVQLLQHIHFLISSVRRFLREDSMSHECSLAVPGFVRTGMWAKPPQIQSPFLLGRHPYYLIMQKEQPALYRRTLNRASHLWLRQSARCNAKYRGRPQPLERKGRFAGIIGTCLQKFDIPHHRYLQVVESKLLTWPSSVVCSFQQYLQAWTSVSLESIDLLYWLARSRRCLYQSFLITANHTGIFHEKISSEIL